MSRRRFAWRCALDRGLLVYVDLDAAQQRAFLAAFKVERNRARVSK